MLKFNNSPERNTPYFGQSKWIGNIYNDLFSDKKDGFLVEIGVGHVFDWNLMGEPRILNENEKFIRGESTTIELLENGWNGIYIEPIKEFLSYELKPLLKTLLSEEHFNKISLCPYAASDYNGVLQIISEQTLSTTTNKIVDEIKIPYNYNYRNIECKKTSEILKMYNCPRNVDVLSIDVEGHELSVLKGIDFSEHLFKLIFIEIDKTTLNEIIEILPKNYSLIKEDGLNAALIYN